MAGRPPSTLRLSFTFNANEGNDSEGPSNITQEEGQQSEPPTSPKAPLSPAAIAHIKQTFSKAAKNARDRAAGQLDWEGVRTPHVQNEPKGPPSDSAQSPSRYNAPNDNNNRQANNVFSTSGSLLSPPLTDEPTSYAQEQDGRKFVISTNNIHTGDPHSESSSDSHSGDEYTYLKQSSPAQSVWKLPTLTAQQRGILKCTIAYTIATFFTFVPVLSGFLAAPFDLEGPVRGGHVVATVATYYNPAKTLGAMFEADIFMLWASLFAFLAAIGSMATASWLNDIYHHTLSHVASVAWLILSMGLIAWMKVKVSHPQFGSACSMVALILICKESSVHSGDFQLESIGQTFATVFLGAGISNAVCLLVWPGSATSKLQGDINKTLESFSTLLDLLCTSFQNEKSRISDDAIKTAIETHRSSFVALQTSLSAAKLELWDYRIQRTHKAYDEILASMNRLAQHITGLRTAVTMKRELENYRKEERRRTRTSDDSGQEADVDNALEIMDTFEEHVGPSLMALAEVARSNLRILRTSFLQSKAGSKAHPVVSAEDEENQGLSDIDAMRAHLQRTLDTYHAAHTKAIRKLYRHFPSALDGQTIRNIESYRALDSRPNEEVLLVYFYCFNLEEFAKEELILVEAFEAVRKEETLLVQERQQYIARFGRVLGKTLDALDVFGLVLPLKTGHAKTDRWGTLRKKLVQLMPLSTAKAPSPFPEIGDNAVTSHSAAQEKQRTFFGRIRRHIWNFGVSLKRPDRLFAIKTGLGCGVLGIAAFDHRTRPIFVRYSGNWAMLSYIVVVAVTTGQTQFNSFFRIGGTLLGASVAVVAWYVLFGHPVALCVFSAIVSLPCFAIIVTKPKFATSGRFILLSYNLTALYAFNVRYSDYDVEEIAYQRIVAVSVGTIWGWIVTRYVYPVEARHELRQGISELLLNYAYYYQRLVGSMSTDRQSPSDSMFGEYYKDDGERTPLLHVQHAKDDRVAKHFIAMETHLQVKLIKLRTYLENAHHEPRLKGPFPVGAYALILQKCQRMLDILHSMRTITLRPEFSDVIRRHFLYQTNRERRDVAGNILLYHSLLASALSLKAPLPPFLPPATDARQRLIDKIASLVVVRRRSIRGTSPYLLYYSYALVEKDLIVQLEGLGSIFQHLFGISGDEDGDGDGVQSFEALFRLGEDTDDGATNHSGTPESSDSEEIGRRRH